MEIFEESKSDKEIKISDQDLFEKIEKLQKVQSDVKQSTSKEKSLKEDLKKIGNDKFLEKYKEKGENPGSITLEVESDLGETAEFTYTPSDRYKTIKSEKEADVIEENIGGGVVSREIKYSFDPNLLEKYKEVLSSMIFNSEEIEDSDKSKLIVAEEKYRVKPGLINEMNQYEDLNGLMNTIKPVVSIKNPKVH
jgi:hypothetical protein